MLVQLQPNGIMISSAVYHFFLFIGQTSCLIRWAFHEPVIHMTVHITDACFEHYFLSQRWLLTIVNFKVILTDFSWRSFYFIFYFWSSFVCLFLQQNHYEQMKHVLEQQMYMSLGMWYLLIIQLTTGLGTGHVCSLGGIMPSLWHC